MALVKSPDKDEIESVENVPKYQVTPRYGGWLIDDKFILEVALPGVSKDDIQIKALQDYFTLRATRENIQYVLDLNLNFRIEPEKVTTKFVEGLLTAEIQRYKPLEHAFVVMSREGKDDEAEKDFYRVQPRVYKHFNRAKNEITVEISIPGVKEDDIDLKVLPTWFHINATRPGEKMKYITNAGFGAEIIPEKTTAEYYNGLLKIKAIVKDPMADAKEFKFD